jgi:hypothetical protein
MRNLAFGVSGSRIRAGIHGGVEASDGGTNCRRDTELKLIFSDIQ